ncbi:hypothetical protein SKAU_G00024430 [Synaphobranchus kaupii]|uniref:Uncharacterized protein n=1 Tax=Synaphobranchus kaupii TaxID=118154 RepID=A0A9Q1GCJ5_SYNKA|nr:hypothetical protein SKAU_G00024430 [Synaphobranchus kaupii]
MRRGRGSDGQRGLQQSVTVSQGHPTPSPRTTRDEHSYGTDHMNRTLTGSFNTAAGTCVAEPGGTAVSHRLEAVVHITNHRPALWFLSVCFAAIRCPHPGKAD